MMTGMRVAIVLLTIVGASAVTPMDKVVTLLKGLSDQVTEQGRKEAISYEKYSCFCKDHAEDKRATIAESEKKISAYEADIELLDGKILQLGGNVKTLGGDISGKDGETEEAIKARAETHAAFSKTQKELDEAIEGVDEAIANLKGPLNLAQLTTGDSAEHLKHTAEQLKKWKAAAFQAKVALGASPESLKAALALVKTAAADAKANSGGKMQEATASEDSASKEVLASLQDIKKTFQHHKASLVAEEIASQGDSTKNVLAMQQQVTFKNKEVGSTQTQLDLITAQRGQADQNKELESKAKTADEAFLLELTTSCGEKATSWDQRSTARADELAALAQATNLLKGASGAKAKYSVNKKLTGLVKVSAVKAKKHSFLQIGKGEITQAEAGEKIVSLLDGAASALKSPVLSALSFQVQLSIDHFTKVRALIKGLVAKLEGDAESEATQKTVCDEQMKLAVDDRDLANARIEEHMGAAAQHTALAEKKAAAIVDFDKHIAKGNKEILEVEALRKTEKADNDAAVVEAQAGQALVESAIEVLGQFYSVSTEAEGEEESPFDPALLGLLQTKYTPPNADRNGATVAGSAPKTFSGEYKGDKALSGGVLGMLQVVRSDFQRTAEAIEAAEEKAAEETEKELENLRDEVGDSAAGKKEAQTAKSDAEGDATLARAEVNDRKLLRAGAKAQLEKLHSMCVQKEESYEERVAKREKEMAALKNAVQLLDALTPQAANE